MAIEKVYIGEELKYRVAIAASGFSMADNDFEVGLAFEYNVN